MQVFAQVGGACPVEMFPAHGAQAVLFIDMQPQADNIFGKDISAFGDAVTQRAVEVEENGFDSVEYVCVHGVVGNIISYLESTSSLVEKYGSELPESKEESM